MTTLRVLTALALGVSLSSGGHAQTEPAPGQLPTPSGASGIGRVVNHWIDARRADPFAMSTQARRELMVYLWYPSDTRTSTGVYLPDVAAIRAAVGSDHLRGLPYWQAVFSGAVSSHAGSGVQLAAMPQRFPIVLFSHGDTAANSFAYTTLIEDIVSHGYVVAAVEHPWSSAAVRFPSGRIIFAEERQRLRGDRPDNVPYLDGVEAAMRDMRQLADIEAADLRFVIDQLERVDGNRESQFFGKLDLSRIAAVGHSLGGMAAIRACQLDARIKACANQDGATADGVWPKFADSPPVVQPVLFIEATPPLTFTDQELAERRITRSDWSRVAEQNAATQEAQLRGVKGGAYRVRVRAPGLTHMSFGDAILAADTAEAQQRAGHNTKLTVDITRAFLDKVLKGYGATPLDEPAARHPEWTVTSYSAR